LNNSLTQAELKRQLHYDPDTGIFTRLISNTNNVKCGDVAGYKDSRGYLTIRVNLILYASHRLAWLYCHGYFPEHQIDHKNGIRNDNRIRNIREASSSCNMQNQKINKKNKSGFPSVSWFKRDRRWMAKMEIQGKQIYLGYYDSPLDAALARVTMEVWCPQWTCNHRSELIKAICAYWPEFNKRSIA